MSFNQDELVAPDWIDSNFLKHILEYSEKGENIKIIDYKMFPGSMRGEHFASIMFRANIKYSTNQNSNANISIILKTLPAQEGLKREMLQNLKLFETEIIMYSKILPTCKEIIRHAGYKDLLSPIMLYQSLEPRKVIVFEDLKELGYSMYSEIVHRQDDWKKIFAKLAQVHASTFKMGADGNKEITKMRGTCFNIINPKKFETFTSGLSLMLEVVETIPGLELCVEKLKQFTVDDLIDKCINTINIPASYNVLNHGDFHINNMMFKCNEEKNCSEIVFVDFQACHWGSPAYDLMCLGYLVPLDLRDEVFHDYFNTFADIIHKSGYTGILPSYAQLQQELFQYRLMDIFVISTMAPFSLLVLNKIECDLELFISNREYRSSFYKTEKYVSLLKQMLPVYLEQGYFDDIINKDK